MIKFIAIGFPFQCYDYNNFCTLAVLIDRSYKFYIENILGSMPFNGRPPI